MGVGGGAGYWQGTPQAHASTTTVTNGDSNVQRRRTGASAAALQNLCGIGPRLLDSARDQVKHRRREESRKVGTGSPVDVRVSPAARLQGV